MNINMDALAVLYRNLQRGLTVGLFSRLFCFQFLIHDLCMEFSSCPPYIYVEFMETINVYEMWIHHLPLGKIRLKRNAPLFFCIDSIYVAPAAEIVINLVFTEARNSN